MTIEKITMPQLGESVTEGTVNTWLIQEGDKVNKYDPIAEIMTDKVNAEVPSSYSGTIKEIVVKEGETIEVGSLMCYIETEDTGNGGNSQLLKAPNKEDKKLNTVDQSMKKRYSPAVLKLAQEHNIDLSTVEGTGHGGRITRKDMERFIGGMNKQKQIKKQAEYEDINNTNEREIQTGDIEIPISGVRKVIADNMVRSKHEIPHAWMTVEVDVTEMVNYRNKIKTNFLKKEGFNLTYFAFFVYAVANALKEYPQLNSVWSGDKIIRKKDINLSIAVAKHEELFVPVIKNADEKSIKGIAKEIHELAQMARENKLKLDHMQNGTFTVNNTGTFGSIHSMGIINYPQVAILQVESIVKRPVIINDMFAARSMVNLSLSLDHRVLDGLICGKFLARLKEILENLNEHSVNVY